MDQPVPADPPLRVDAQTFELGRATVMHRAFESMPMTRRFTSGIVTEEWHLVGASITEHGAQYARPA